MKAQTEVYPLWFFNTPEGNIQLGLRRLRDVTPPDNDRNSLLIRFGGERFHDPNFSGCGLRRSCVAIVLYAGTSWLGGPHGNVRSNPRRIPLVIGRFGRHLRKVSVAALQVTSSNRPDGAQGRLGRGETHARFGCCRVTPQAILGGPHACRWVSAQF